jgi:hypothetical protein
MEAKQSGCHRLFLLFRNILYVGVAYAVIAAVIHLIQTGGSIVHPTRNDSPAKPSAAPSRPRPTGTPIQRPESLVIAKDDFLGTRPHVDTYANFTMIVDYCRGSAAAMEKFRDIYSCLEFLAGKESEYFFIPQTDAPSKASKTYPTIEEAKKQTEDFIGECPGPIMNFHTYWTGPATWRVEIFIKSYLYTQNLPCSRLNIWLDADAHKFAKQDMMRDPIFSKFLPLVKRGDIVLQEWRFPSRIPLPTSPENVDPWYADQQPDPTTGVTIIGDGVIREADGSEWVVLTARQLTFLPVAVSDAVRFVVLHLWGGLYCDMDVLMIRDFRPLLLPPTHAFAERWALHTDPGDYNTAIMSLSANSSLSSYLLRGGVRMGLNFHPRIIGRMAWKDKRNEEFVMFESGLFDPIWGEFNWGREGRCSIPCLKDYDGAFIGHGEKVKASMEWESYDDKPLKEIYPRGEPTPFQHRVRRGQIPNIPATQEIQKAPGEYDISTDLYPPNNRTMEHFFKGAFSYHIHNQWKKAPQPNSWFDIIMKVEDGYLRGERVNPYGEKWLGPQIAGFQTWPEFDYYRS